VVEGWRLCRGWWWTGGEGDREDGGGCCSGRREIENNLEFGGFCVKGGNFNGRIRLAQKSCCARAGPPCRGCGPCPARPSGRASPRHYPLRAGSF
jgi:hypothetical protein